MLTSVWSAQSKKSNIYTYTISLYHYYIIIYIYICITLSLSISMISMCMVRGIKFWSQQSAGDPVRECFHLHRAVQPHSQTHCVRFAACARAQRSNQKGSFGAQGRQTSAVSMAHHLNLRHRAYFGTFQGCCTVQPFWTHLLLFSLAASLCRLSLDNCSGVEKSVCLIARLSLANASRGTPN